MAKVTVSIVKGKGSLNHNNREFLTDNVDKTRTADNVIYKRETLEDAYMHCFSAAIEEYNAKQKRADRRIDGVKGYIEQLHNSKNGEKLFYENVVQVGNMFDSRTGTIQGNICRKILDEYMRGFQERNPNLYVFNAVMHLDEQTPHLHIDYIPIAKGYKQGLQVRNSLDRAFRQQGIEGKSNRYENRTIVWQNVEKDCVEKIMKLYGLERAPDRGLDQEHLTVEQYKAVAGRIRNEVSQIPKQIETAPMMLNKERVTVKKEDLEQLEQRAKLSIVYEKATKKLVMDIKKEAKTASEYHSEKMSSAADAILKADKELKKAEETRQGYEELYKSQEELNARYENLHKEYEEQKQVIDELSNENRRLKAQIADLRDFTEKRVQKAVEPLKRQIQAFKERTTYLEERLDGMCQSLTNVVKAFNLLRYDNTGEYRIYNLNEKQARLFAGIENYTKKFLRIEGKTDMAEDIEKSIGVSKGISDHIRELIPKRSRDLDIGR